MQNYALSQELASVFKENPWSTFMGKYFGFPECCVKDFCQSSVKIPSPFDGTGYVPCSCCNKLIVSDIVKQEFTLGKLTSSKKQSLLEDLELEQSYKIDHIKTKNSIKNYHNDIDTLMELCLQSYLAFQAEKPSKNHKNKNKNSQI